MAVYGAAVVSAAGKDGREPGDRLASGLGGEEGVVQAEGSEDSGLQVVRHGFAGDFLEEQTGDDVVGVRVVVIGARREVARSAGRVGEHVVRAPGSIWISEQQREEVLGDVGDST